MSAQITEDLSPAQGAHVMRFEAADGRIVEWTSHEAKRFEVEPLDFAQLVNAAASQSPVIPVVIRNAHAPAALTGLAPLTIRAELGNNGPVQAYGLVDGGWLPMPWAHKRIAWLDRNVLIALEKLKLDAETKLGPGDPTRLARWLGLDTESVSPILFALEGPERRPPTDFVMRAELGRARKALERVLQGVKIQAIDSGQRRALHRMVLENSEGRAQATRLLLRAIPLVVDRAKPELRRRVEEDVLRIAREERVRVDSLPVLALLSCIYDSGPAVPTHRAATPGRAVLKPRQVYSQQDAYNALADMFFLELMFNALAIFPDMHPVLYTRDVGIAALWTVLQPSRTHVEQRPNGKSRTTIVFGLDQGLFPALTTAEHLELKERLGL